MSVPERGGKEGAARIEAAERGEVAVLAISNPSKRNALDPGLLLDLEAKLDRLAAGGTRAVVLRGAGDRIFSAGYDIGAIRGGSGEEASRNPIGRAIAAIERFPAPVIGMAFGGAWGAAVEVLASCDLRFAADDARFAIPAGKLSVVYDAAGLARLATRASHALVGELLYTARPLDASRALALGLLNGVHPASELESAVLGLAAEVGALAPRTLRATKQILAALAAHGTLSAGEIARFTELRNQAIGSADFAEGQRAFAEKRRPNFSGE